jgi:hypothetical protein
MRDAGESAEECRPSQADFWGLFGVDENENRYAIGDFSEKSDAEFIRDAIHAS